ncbi:hypothetical protein Asp14428_76540 [Actinoplanes sp. NBRC 14428]|uniref:Uncharacterized protein n=1 Tax=Pseudosporangium ferrugineum TaxID=439699 RepID=A0A2T0RX73_9ACTN|nr:hypothetical protein [Pseudosporangium ferrugineum]PRY25771.1 hypothetical protein CLV70_112137 [Pseudosporangium ferrugineum]BCJ56179.1 hypothetical protein Asp14428_76540 [Actinoplanes sp. NBRC 14428]
MSFSPPASVSLRLPQDWAELDPRAGDLAADLRRAVEARWAAHDLISTERLVALLTPPARELRRQGEQAYVVVVGLYTDVVPVAGSTEPLVVTAHAMLSMSPPVGSLDDVRRDLGEAAETVTLPSGPAVRLSGPVPVPAPDGPGAAYRRWYVVPVPGTDRVATLAFLTPNTELADVFNDVFDAVADSLTFGWKD